MNAFIDSNDVLVAYGFIDSNNDDTLVEVPDDFDMPVGGAQYTNGSWQLYSAPVDYTVVNTATRESLMRSASIALAPLQIAISLNEATTDETSLAQVWLTYSRALKAVDLTQQTPAWPVVPE